MNKCDIIFYFYYIFIYVILLFIIQIANFVYILRKNYVI